MPLLPLVLLAIHSFQASAPEAPRDARSIILLDEDCRSPIDHRQVTLFANGTVRLRQGQPGSERMTLLELPEGDLAAYVKQLAALDWSDTEASSSSPSGEWTEACRLELSLEGRQEIDVGFDRYSTGTLALEMARRVAADLIERASRDAVSLEIPAAYAPAIGDELERNDGVVFRIVGFTSDGHGVELAGVESPLTIYVEKARLREIFRRRISGPPPP